MLSFLSSKVLSFFGIIAPTRTEPTEAHKVSMSQVCKEIYFHRKTQHPEAIPELPHRLLLAQKGGVNYWVECPSCKSRPNYDGKSGRHNNRDTSFCFNHLENASLRPRVVKRTKYTERSE